jgi:hypothetical protein
VGPGVAGETDDGGGRSGADDEQPAGIPARHGQQAIADFGRSPARGGSEPIEIIDKKRAIKAAWMRSLTPFNPSRGIVAAAKTVQLRRA